MRNKLTETDRETGSRREGKRYKDSDRQTQRERTGCKKKISRAKQAQKTSNREDKAQCRRRESWLTRTDSCALNGDLITVYSLARRSIGWKETFINTMDSFAAVIGMLTHTHTHTHTTRTHSLSPSLSDTRTRAHAYAQTEREREREGERERETKFCVKQILEARTYNGVCLQLSSKLSAGYPYKLQFFHTLLVSQSQVL